MADPRDVLRNLAKEGPSSKAAKVRALLPEIELARRSGITLTRIAASLQEGGINVKTGYLWTILQKAKTRPDVDTAKTNPSDTRKGFKFDPKSGTKGLI